MCSILRIYLLRETFFVGTDFLLSSRTPLELNLAEHSLPGWPSYVVAGFDSADHVHLDLKSPSLLEP